MKIEKRLSLERSIKIARTYRGDMVEKHRLIGFFLRMRPLHSYIHGTKEVP